MRSASYPIFLAALFLVGLAAAPARAQDSGGCSDGNCCGGACSCGTFCGCGGSGDDLGDNNPPQLGLDGFPRSGVNLLSNFTLQQMGVTTTGVLGNDIWGWSDALTGKDYALFGLTNGVAFVDLSDRRNPEYLGTLPTHTGNAVWRDLKVYEDHVFVVADGNGAHGMQVFDLTRLRGVSEPQVFTEDAHYDDVTNVHNMAINEDTGFAYLVGSSTFSGGLHIVDVRNPLSPVQAMGYSADGYIHDTQVVVYRGPDADYFGREIAFNSAVNEITIADVTDADLQAPLRISASSYSNGVVVGYVHQGWLTEDQRYFLQNDELDDDDNGTTRTHIWDLADLDNPVYVGFHDLGTVSIDHNLFIVGDLVFEANYTTGLRILEMTDLESAVLTEIGYLDTHPEKDSVSSFDGAWSVYPFFADGTIIVSDRQRGLFVLRIPEPATGLLAALVAGALLLRRRRQSSQMN